MPRYMLIGSEYVSEELFKSGSKVLWEDVPGICRVTEGMVRGATGAYDKAWLEQHLTTYGCKRAVPFRDKYFRQCPYKVLDNGFCKRHNPERALTSRTRKAAVV